jgi:phosphoribosyl 1,2-cyclic phosphodiesterase
VGDSHNHVLIDAGISGKKIEEGLNSFDYTSKDMDGILVTHEHIDHISGLGVMARRHHIPIYATAATISAIKNTTSVGKIDEGLFNVIESDKEFNIGSLSIKPISISHDAADPVAYRIESEGKSAAVLTDLGVYDDYIIDAMQNLDCLLLESNHDKKMLEVGPYPYSLKVRIMGEKGHLSNDTAGQLLSKLLNDDIKHVFLGHLSHENNYSELALRTVDSEITLSDTKYKGDDFPIEVARRDEVSRRIEF